MPADDLTAAEAAARLGVKPETLYAYVSRGLLRRTRTATGSRFDPLEIEAFAANRARGRAVPSASGRVAGTPLMVVETDVALIEDDELFFRGEPSVALAAAWTFDAVAAWVWGEPLTADRRLTVPAQYVAVARPVVEALPASAGSLDRVLAAVQGLGAADPLRREVSPAALVRAGELLLAGVPRALAGATAHGAEAAAYGAGATAHGAGAAAGAPEAPRVPDTASVPEAVWHALAGRAPTSAEVRAINVALVLSLDHDLAASTLAARVAASARASGYAVVTAALGAFDSPLHGNASRPAAQLIADVRSGVSAGAAIRAQLQLRAAPVPGFGQRLYSGIDPRAAAILAAVADLPDGAEVLAVIGALRDEMSGTGLQPNIDLGLAALTVAAGLPDDAGPLLFALGRSAGWIAHALAEYGEPPLRLRPQGRYVGPPPRG